MPYLHEPGSSEEIAPGGKIEKAAVAVAADAFFVVPSRVRAEQDAPGLQGVDKFR
jgi:hypothetical protein